ncbi:MAG: hypothetical protein DRJ63_08565 [Thermoprotei archaeon]|nr:MAG: hypothetical protein DRJ63_08565 [Thermoprotei archaeon]
MDRNYEDKYSDLLTLLEALPEVIRTLYKGISTLKVSIELLSERVNELERTLGSVAKLIDEKTTALVNTTNELKENLRDLSSTSDKLSEELPKEVADAVRNAVSQLTETINKLEDFYMNMSNELTLIKRSFGDQVTVTLESMNEIKGDILSLRAKIEDLTVCVNELSTTVRKEFDETRSKVHELELMVADLSVRLTSLEQRVKGVLHE